eukprot:6193631-Pleurochrysis_carterae.AAC.5
MPFMVCGERVCKYATNTAVQNVAVLPFELLGQLPVNGTYRQLSSFVSNRRAKHSHQVNAMTDEPHWQQRIVSFAQRPMILGKRKSRNQIGLPAKAKGFS